MRAPAEDTTEDTDLRMDVEELVAKGWSDDQIVREIDPEDPDALCERIQYSRARLNESCPLKTNGAGR